jgi:four helix bundle protein
MNSEELKKRTKKFALEVIKFVSVLPNKQKVNIIAQQLLRAATSVGANYRAACRSRSKSEFISKIGIVEADESLYWLEIISESGLVSGQKLDNLLKEANELVAIFVSTRKSAEGF